jgi:hypothetical protein
MAEDYTAPDLYIECLTAMAASGEVYPCETLAPVLQADCALPDAPSTPTLPDQRAAALTGQTERT